MSVLRLLNRASRPRIAPNVSGGNLAPMAAWQNSLFGNWPAYGSADTFPWQYVTTQEALDLPVVGGFLSLMTGLVFQMPLDGYRGSRNIGDIVLPKPAILQNPTPGLGRTFAQWIEEYLRDMCLYGNYLAILGPIDANGWPSLMYTVPWSQWSIEIISETGTYFYSVNGQPYGPSEVFHVRRNACGGDLIGRGVLQLFPRLIASSVAAEVWAAGYYETGAVPPAQVEHPNPELTQAQADELKAKWRQAVKAHEAVITPLGTNIHVLSSNAEEAQLNETRRMNAQQLAMAIGVPGALLGLDSPSLTYRNITDVYQQFITSTVMGYLVPLEQQFTEQCLPRGQMAAFNANQVLRPDVGARVDLAVKAIGSQMLSQQESRVFIDLPPDEMTPEQLKAFQARGA